MEREKLASDFLKRKGWGEANRSFLQGDASSRQYERLNLKNKKALFVDSPSKTDGPKLENGKTYSQTAHLAESAIPFVAIDHYLADQGFSVPEIYAVDMEQGFLILEDLGRDVYGKKIVQGDDMDLPYIEAINNLVHMAGLSPPQELSLPNGDKYKISHFDRQAFLIEVDLFTSWFWKWLGLSLSTDAVKSFQDIWSEAFDRIDQSHLVLNLRDYHSPNLIWCEEREGLKRAAMIDFQDAVVAHPAYDLVSLLQDARTDIPAEVEDEYKSLYKKRCSEQGLLKNEEHFDLAYAIMGAQRNTKILGIFARLALRDHKPEYLTHIPRVLGYLERCLNAPGLGSLRAWYDTYLPDDMRREICLQLGKSVIGRNAIVLSAGLGTRMSPLSDTCPKPLIKLLDKPLLEYGLDKLSEIGAGKIVVNVHYLASQIEKYIGDCWSRQGNNPKIVISDEKEQLLETGGGIKKALPHLGNSPFFVLNSDSIWVEENENNLLRLIDGWDDKMMDCLILLANREQALGYEGQGDFELLSDGSLRRRGKDETPYVVSGTYLVHPRLFEDSPDGPFSMNILWDKALDEGRLFGIELQGAWLHIGTPEAVDEAEKYISGQNLGLS